MVTQDSQKDHQQRSVKVKGGSHCSVSPTLNDNITYRELKNNLMKHDPDRLDQFNTYLQGDDMSKTKSLTLRIDEKIHQKLKILSDYEKKTMIRIIEEAVEERFKKAGYPEPK